MGTRIFYTGKEAGISIEPPGRGVTHDELSNVIPDQHHLQFHAAEHVAGDDIIADAVAAGNAGLMTGADKTKLNGIETDATDDQTEDEILNLLGLTSAEVETLTDNSMADALHRHSELSASDGSPDAIVYVDSDGVLYVDYAYGIGLDVLHSANIGNSLIIGNNLTVGGTIINTDFTTLTDGSDADALHAHSGVFAIAAVLGTL